MMKLVKVLMLSSLIFVPAYLLHAEAKPSAYAAGQATRGLVEIWAPEQHSLHGITENSAKAVHHASHKKYIQATYESIKASAKIAVATAYCVANKVATYCVDGKVAGKIATAAKNGACALGERAFSFTKRCGRLCRVI